MNKYKLTWIIILAFLLVGAMAVMAATLSSPTSDGGVVPYILKDAQGGNVECEQLGYDFSSDRVNYNGGFDAEFPEGIEVTVTDGTYVAWTSTFPIGAVIVKGGNAANIYEYIPPSLGDSGLASPPNESGDPAGLSNLTFCWNLALEVSKDADTTFDRVWTWDIEKTGDQTNLTLAVGQQFLVNYDVKVSAVSEDSNWAVSGEITIYNPNPTAVATIESVTDVVSPDIAATVDCGVTFPYGLAGGETLTCDYSAELPNGESRTNTATVTTSGKVAGGSGTAAVTFGDPTNETDECIDVTDDQHGFLGTVCANEAPKTFEYSMYIGPYAVCGEYEFVNTATFVTNDTETEGSDSWTVDVDVPCVVGCTLTPGYWKTHSKYGPAPYDDTWAEIGEIGEDTPFFLSGQSYYEVLWTEPEGNAYYILAHAYIAAELNQLNGADFTAAQDAFAEATGLFATYTPAQIGALRGNDPLRQQFLALATILDDYNNGLIGPGHCSE
jgi:hypothetical protein